MLKDGRGRKKATEELTEADHHRLAMRKLEYEMERLRAENAFLKRYRNSKGGEAKRVPSGEPLPCHSFCSTRRVIQYTNVSSYKAKKVWWVDEPEAVKEAVRKYLLRQIHHL